MENNNLPKCYIFDVDGTIAHRTGRSPYDYSRVEEDVVDESMKIIYQGLLDVKNFIVDGKEEGIYSFIITGREESCRGKTIDWLSRHGFFYNQLVMRPIGNKELDADLKARIYRENIKDKYNVIAVFEDRERVVKMWRDHLKLKCLQVDWGKF